MRKRHSHKLFAFIFCLSFLIINPAYAASTARITTSNADQDYADIFDTRIVWLDSRYSTNGDIYYYDTVTGVERQLTTTSYSSYDRHPSIFGNKIVWQNGSTVYLYDLLSGVQIPIGTGTDPEIFNNHVVWENNRNTTLYNLIDGTTFQIPSSGPCENPVVSENYVVYLVNNDSTAYQGIHAWNIQLSNEMVLFSNLVLSDNDLIPDYPSISGTKVVWEAIEKANGNNDIYFHEIPFDTTIEITKNSAAMENDPQISNSLVVWDGLVDDHQIYLYDIDSQTTTRVSSTSYDQFRPAISGSRIAWTDRRNGNDDIYLRTLDTPQSIPTLSFISPLSVSEGSGEVNITVIGSDFHTDSKVRRNGVDRPTTYISPGELRVQLSASDTSSAGTCSITVYQPAPGGGTSSAQTFTVTEISTNPEPILLDIEPETALVGGPGFTLTATGYGFIPESKIRWNGTDRVTSYKSAMELEAQITAEDVASLGEAQVTVFNPSPGGGTSTSKIFTISSTNPIPSLLDISPDSITAGYPSSFSLTVSGQGFIPSSMVRWNGINRTTLYGNSSTLTAQIIPQDVSNAGNASISVFNPPPGGGISANTVTFTINSPSSGGEVEFMYDPNGNMVSGPGYRLEYNDADQVKKVIRISDNQTIAQYWYDDKGNRVKKLDPITGITTYYIGDYYESEVNGTTIENTTYYFANSERVAQKNPDGSMLYYHTDHLGSTGAVTNQTGAVVESVSYIPYGEMSSHTGAATKYFYTGKEQDTESGLYYYGARYYEPRIMRFVQPDTIIQDLYNPQNLNRYSYVINNPLRYTDPTGNFYLRGFAGGVSNILLGLALMSAGGVVGGGFGAVIGAPTTGMGIGTLVCSVFADESDFQTIQRIDQANNMALDIVNPLHYFVTSTSILAGCSDDEIERNQDIARDVTKLALLAKGSPDPDKACEAIGLGAGLISYGSRLWDIIFGSSSEEPEKTGKSADPSYQQNPALYNVEHGEDSTCNEWLKSNQNMRFGEGLTTEPPIDIGEVFSVDNMIQSFSRDINMMLKGAGF